MCGSNLIRLIYSPWINKNLAVRNFTIGASLHIVTTIE